MKYISYDGSLEGLFTVIFQYYKEIFKISIEKEKDQIDFLEKTYVKTEMKKAYRVEKAIKNKISQSFIDQIAKNFKSKDIKKEDLIARVIKLSFHYGKYYLGSSDKYAVRFRQNLKNYSSEVHAYKGLVRFSKIQEDFLFAKINAENDIIKDLSLHFIKRMPKEKFIIYDENRKEAFFYIKGKYELVDVIDLKIKEEEKEELYKNLWISFYQTITIKERKNTKLMISNMPKKYWKYLPEKNGGI